MTTTQVPKKKRRGFEGTGDMLRSLGLVLLVVVPIWFLAQPSPEDQAEIRAVDQSGDIAAWSSEVPGAPVPDAPDAWVPTVSSYDAGSRRLRLGWNTDTGRYAEYAAATSPESSYVEELTGSADDAGTEQVEGQPWRRYVDDDGSVSLVRELGEVTVVVGTTRASATLDELRALAASLG